MPEQDFEYDVFLSHASEDANWGVTLAARLRNEDVRTMLEQYV